MLIEWKNSSSITDPWPDCPHLPTFAHYQYGKGRGKVAHKKGFHPSGLARDAGSPHPQLLL